MALVDDERSAREALAADVAAVASSDEPPELLRAWIEHGVDRPGANAAGHADRSARDVSSANDRKDRRLVVAMLDALDDLVYAFDGVGFVHWNDHLEEVTGARRFFWPFICSSIYPNGIRGNSAARMSATCISMRAFIDITMLTFVLMGRTNRASSGPSPDRAAVGSPQRIRILIYGTPPRVSRAPRRRPSPSLVATHLCELVGPSTIAIKVHHSFRRGPGSPGNPAVAPER